MGGVVANMCDSILLNYKKRCNFPFHAMFKIGIEEHIGGPRWKRKVFGNGDVAQLVHHEF